MLEGHQDYRSFLKWTLAERIPRNSRYSLRAFARDLGIHHSMLVHVFQKKKRLSVDRAHLVAHRLDLREREYEYFCLLVEIENAKTEGQKMALQDRLLRLAPSTTRRDLTIEHFRLLSDWYHFPILQMAGMKDFNFTASHIADRLGISSIEAEVAIERLVRLELIEKELSGKYRKTDSRLLAGSATPADALRQFHKQMLEKAIASLTEQSPQEKWMDSETFAFDTGNLPEANTLIEQFFDRMVQLSLKRRE